MSVCARGDVCYVLSVMVIVLHRRFEYESTDTSREEMKRKFAPTMEFVEEYLKDVVSQPFPFGEKDKNELTLEVIWAQCPSETYSVPDSTSQLRLFYFLSCRW